MKASACGVISALEYARLKQHEHSKERYKNNITYHGGRNRQSIWNRIEACFNYIVFILRKDMEKEFKEVIGDRIASICSNHNVTVDYAFLDINDIPGKLPSGCSKQWGSG